MAWTRSRRARASVLPWVNMRVPDVPKRRPEFIPMLGIRAYFGGLSNPNVVRCGLRVAAGKALNTFEKPMSEPVFKICPALALQEGRKRERYEGSAADARDGFIHLSAGHQVARTLAKYFAGQNDLALLAIDPDRLGANLRWEPSRSGELFPISTGRSTSPTSSRSRP